MDIDSLDADDKKAADLTVDEETIRLLTKMEIKTEKLIRDY